MKFKTKLNMLIETLRIKGLKDLLNLCLNYFTLKLEPERVWTEPIYLQLEPTTRCNLKCKMCYGSYERRICDDLTLEGFQKIINQFPRLIKIHLQGIGEPLLNKNIFKMIRYAKSKGIKIDLATNATLIDLNMAKEIVSSGLDYIEFSIDSSTPQIYEEIRSGANFEKVVSNIKNLIKEKGDSKKPEMKIITLVMNETVDEIPQMVKFVHQLGINSLLLIQVQPWDENHLKKLYKDEINFTQRAKKSMLEAKKVAKELKVYLDLTTPITTGLVRGCKRPWISVSVLCDGYVVPCCRVINPDEINFGNVFKDNFKDIWNSVKYKAFRKALKGDFRPTVCNNCYFYYRNPMDRDHV